MSRESIASALKRLREKSGLTADEVGKKIGKSGKTVNAWENNRGQPDAEMLIKLCDLYDVDNILDEFRDNVVAENLSLSRHEKKVIIAYRERLDMQGAVDTLLGIKQEDPKTCTIYRAARSADHHGPTIEKRSIHDIARLENAPAVTSEDDL